MPSQRVVIEPWHLLSLPLPVLPNCKPISHSTRSRAPAPLALFNAGQPLHKCVTYHIPTVKSVRATAEPIGFAGLCKAMQPAEIDGFAYLCQALMHVSGPEALSVLDPSTGKFLEHCQLHRDPRYKATWDTLYTNELGRLCQGICTGPSPNTKWVAGTNIFFHINYHDIPCHKRKEICHTMVVCKVHLEKDDPDCTLHNHWRQSHLLPGQRWNQYCIPQTCQASSQQRAFSPRCTFQLHQPQEFLPQYSNARPQICLHVVGRLHSLQYKGIFGMPNEGQMLDV